MAYRALTAAAILAALGACGEREVILPGERLDLRAGEPGAAETASRAQPISLPAPVSLAEWTHKAANPRHELPHLALSAQPRLAWSAEIGQGEDRRHRITADPVVAGGRVYTVDSRATVAAHAANGQPLWSRDLTPPGDSEDDASGAGLAVAGSTLLVSTGFGDLVALDAASGAEIWRQELDASAAGAPTVRGDTVYVVGRDGTGWAVNLADGRVRWTVTGTPSPSGVTGGAAPAAGDTRVVFPFASGELLATLPREGTQTWSTYLAGNREGRAYAQITDISGDPVIDGGTLYAGSPSGRMGAYDLSSGTALWTADEGAMSPVTVAGGSIFAVSDLNGIARLDAATGELIWKTDLPLYRRAGLTRRKDVFAHYGPVLAGGRLWVASSDGLLRAFDPVSGAPLAQVDLPDGATTNPVVVGGTLYLVTEDGRLLAFR